MTRSLGFIGAGLLLALLALPACQGTLSGGGDDVSGDDDGDDSPGGIDGGGGPGDPDAGGPPVDTSVELPLGPVRPVDIMPLDRLAIVAGRMPKVADPALRAILESPDTMWYDRTSIIPGYQDSYGDNINFPTGMRPNTIDPGLIAVAGGHGFIFEEIGSFHFPFGRPAGFTDQDGFVVDFWHVPRGAGGALLPVVWWWREPTSWHHRLEWMFPVGTVFGEVMFIVDGDGTWYPFEIRTRTRRVDGWSADAHRPFANAESLAAALEQKRQQQPAWAQDPQITALIAHLRDPGTLQASSLGASHFDGTFPSIAGARDILPALADAGILRALLMETPFVSAKQAVWKQSGSLRAYAATAGAGFSIVPTSYNAGFVRVDDQECARCHQDAGRPFRDFYPSIMLYGELWGEDQIFSWHPFETKSFVNASGQVVGFGPPDNRKLRPDFVGAGLLEAYSASKHPAATYKQIPADWRDYVYD